MESLVYLQGCLHQRENRCDEPTGLSRISDQLRLTALGNRSSLVRLLELVEADCSYCLLETIEHVGGAGFVARQLKVLTDYPIRPRACLPELANALAAAQAEAVRANVESRSPLGLSALDADVAEIFIPVPTGSRDGAFVAYRGMHLGEYLYRCSQGPGETWAIVAEQDPDAWSRCEGRLWIDLGSASIRDATGRLGGIFFGLGAEACSDDFAMAAAGNPDAGASSNADSQSESTLTFSEDASAAQVACGLFWRFGAFSPGGGQGRSVVVQLPSALREIPLFGDIIVRTREHLTLQAAPTVLLEVGQWQLQVDAGGRLDLLGVGLVDSVDSPAIAIHGEVTAANCTFARCAAGPGVLLRYAENLARPGSAESPPVHGAFFLASGGVAVLWTVPLAKFTASACVFSENIVRGGCQSEARGGAIFAMGGHIVLNDGTAMQSNVAEGGVRATGGAITAIFTRVDINQAVFIGNEARGMPDSASCPGTSVTAAGAMSIMDRPQGTISSVLSTRFEANRARDASDKASGAAIQIEIGAILDVRGCMFVRNAALRGGRLTCGGAIRVADQGQLYLAETTFAENAVIGPSESSSGAIHTEGILVLLGGVSFDGNQVDGGVSSLGGALSVRPAGTGSHCLNSSGLPGPMFRNNSVRASCATAWSHYYNGLHFILSAPGLCRHVAPTHAGALCTLKRRRARSRCRRPCSRPTWCTYVLAKLDRSK